MTFLPIFKLWWMTSRICLKRNEWKAIPYAHMWIYDFFCGIASVTSHSPSTNIGNQPYVQISIIFVYAHTTLLRCWMPIFIFDSVNYTYINHTMHALYVRMKSTFNNPSFSTNPIDGAYTINYSSINMHMCCVPCKMGSSTPKRILSLTYTRICYSFSFESFNVLCHTD